jgi:hypothetical protein
MQSLNLPDGLGLECAQIARSTLNDADEVETARQLDRLVPAGIVHQAALVDYFREFSNRRFQPRGCGGEPQCRKS